MTNSSSTSLYVVGLGPGSHSFITPEAASCLSQSAVIVGYKAYIELVPEDFLQGKYIISTGMMQEIDRVQEALTAAKNGKTTSLVCSGDPGIYAMAGLALELLEQEKGAAVSLQIIPGVPAVCAAAALLGAPLMHDFACISLSDLLTPIEIIEKRLECAFAGDFVVALYNPKSRRRVEPLTMAYEIAKKYKDCTTPVGIVNKAFRLGQRVWITTLERVEEIDVDMFSIIIMGNSTSRIVAGTGEYPLSWEHGARILTPRGYAEKYGL